MHKHVDLIGVLYLIWGAIGLGIGLSIMSLALGAASIVRPGAPDTASPNLAAGVTAASFVAVAALVLIWGGVHVWAGRGLRSHREWARTFALVLAIANLVIPPFGTALGAYGLWVLLNEQARPLFVRSVPL
jgi:hypothetical protein